ncbi:MAG: oligosaccharide flippase family protein [Oscillospiraceae bacterium]|nr:oligosaccharide flippase family protein [Oscillospiraceae bacterium]
MKNSIARDTAFLTVIQLSTQVLSLVLNIYTARMLGTESLGLIALVYTFFSFAMIISNGNIFVSTSRFVSEERGKSCGNPRRIFRYSLIFSLLLSCMTAACVFVFAEPLGMRFIKDETGVSAIRLLALSLPMAALGSCMKGYFHACRKVVIPAIADMTEFCIKSAIIALSAGILIRKDILTIYNSIAISIICGEAASCIMLICSIISHARKEEPSKYKTIGFFSYILSLIPVILNSYIPCILSTANDALVPITLNQSGCSTSESLSQYGIFEAVVLPVLFFPSMFLSCLSVILIPEISRCRTAGRSERNKEIINNVISKTITYSIFIVSFFLIYGNEVGTLISKEPQAGRMIMLLAPVVPFIYLEIILEGIIKGMGRHSFSSLNYLAEYIIRISSLLICVPVMGFYGIAVSYYLSNIAGNISRMVMIIKSNSMKFSLREFVTNPVISAVCAWQFGMLLKTLLRLDSIPLIPQMILYSMICLLVYWFICRVLNNVRPKQAETL